MKTSVVTLALFVAGGAWALGGTTGLVGCSVSSPDEEPVVDEASEASVFCEVLRRLRADMLAMTWSRLPWGFTVVTEVLLLRTGCMAMCRCAGSKM